MKSRSVRLGLSFRDKPRRTLVLLLRFALGAELLLDSIECRVTDWIYSVICIRWLYCLIFADPTIERQDIVKVYFFLERLNYPKQKALQITELYHRYAIYTSY